MVSRVVCVDVGSEKFGLGDERDEPGLGLRPFDEIAEVDVGGEIMVAGAGPGFGPGQALLVEIGAQAAIRLTVVEVLVAGTVVDGEHSATLPVGQHVAQPLVITLMDLDDLTVRPCLMEKGAFREFGDRLPEFSLGKEVVFFPLITVFSETADWEGVGELVRVETGVPVAGIQRICDAGVPGRLIAEENLLLFTE